MSGDYSLCSISLSFIYGYFYVCTCVDADFFRLCIDSRNYCYSRSSLVDKCIVWRFWINGTHDCRLASAKLYKCVLQVLCHNREELLCRQVVQRASRSRGMHLFLEVLYTGGVFIKKRKVVFRCVQSHIIQYPCGVRRRLPISEDYSNKNLIRTLVACVRVTTIDSIYSVSHMAHGSGMTPFENLASKWGFQIPASVVRKL